MHERIAYAKVAPAAPRADDALEEHIRGCGPEHRLLELVEARASQLNPAEPDRTRSRSVFGQDVSAALGRARVRSARTDDLMAPGYRSSHG
ncbi:MAG: hypothetical protein PHQ91_09115 [Thermoanaerobaculaceae bacterium]|nr:hypothetical protein [Thermoanaerobaculaceae bacterium]